jgi:two-component system chemotaxis response regulator CheY
MKKKVILVDDSKTIHLVARDAVKELTGGNLIEFVTYLNPKELLTELLDDVTDFDMMFVDVNMPEMNGLELSKAIRADEKYRKKPIVILTTENSEELKHKGRVIGVAGWMQKPLKANIMVKVIKQVLDI